MIKKTTFLALICLYCIHNSYAEGTFPLIYNQIFTTKCNNAGCHNNTDKAGGLNLEGTGSDASQNLEKIKAGMYDISPKNTVAMAKKNKLIFPGDPYRSYIFRLFNNGLATDVEIDPAEIPAEHADVMLTNTETEFIRQWIMYNSPISDKVASHDLITPFYAGEGAWNIPPDQAPAKPALNKGFQIHIGPIFLPPWENADQPDVEYGYKYPTLLPEDIEIQKVGADIGSSHHFIVYRFTGSADNKPAGLRKGGVNFNNITMVTAFAQSGLIKLPEGSAFKWDKEVVLDLNPHVVNYSTTAILASDIYINVYTQPVGTAAQEMKIQLIANPAIYIPADGEEYTFEAPSSYPANITYHVWKMSSHAHQKSKAFDVWLRNSDGTKGEHIYSASKYDGTPQCEDIAYDYQHPPSRTFSPFLELPVSKGIIQRATYVNNTDTPATWGETVDDEMMITGIFYVTNTSGIIFPNAQTCFDGTAVEPVGIQTTDNDLLPFITKLNAYAQPNVVAQGKNINFVLQSPEFTTTKLYITDLLGRRIYTSLPIILKEDTPTLLPISTTTNFGTGTFLYTLQSNTGEVVTGKILLY